MNNKYKALCNDFLIQTAVINQHKQYLLENNIVTLQNIKDEFYAYLAQDCTLCMSLDQYITDNFEQVYDAELNFIGYQRK